MAEASPDSFSVVAADQVANPYDGSDVPGEFRSLTEALGAQQVAITLIRVPPHSDFEQGTGHRHDQPEELYLVSRGTLTMRFGSEIRRIGDEPVELWAISCKGERGDATKVDDFWEASPAASQHANADGEHADVGA